MSYCVLFSCRSGSGHGAAKRERVETPHIEPCALRSERVLGEWVLWVLDAVGLDATQPFDHQHTSPNRAQPNATAAERAPKPYSVYSLAFLPPAGGACLGAQEPRRL